MSTPLTINGTTFNYPVSGEAPNWGEEATGWAAEVTAVLGTLNGPGDILNTLVSVANNQAVAANIPGLSFDTSIVRAAKIDYYIYRVTSLEEKVEQGTIHLAYKPVANVWDLANTYSGDAGITFTITTGGQMQYTSDNMTGTGYTSRMRFIAKGFQI